MNELEYKSWEDTRRKGIVIYALSKSAFWIALITLIKWILTKKVSIAEDMIFFVGLIIAYSATWFVNEKRFQDHSGSANS